MSEVPEPAETAKRRARRQTWGLVAAAVALYGVIRLVFGPLPQDPAYHVLADIRRCGPIPRAGDVLTNLFILAAGAAGLPLWRRVRSEPEERAAYALLVAGMVLTAIGSAYYHWAPGDARLVWDRLPMTMVLAALLAFLLADGIGPAFATVARWPIAALGAASVLCRACTRWLAPTICSFTSSCALEREWRSPVYYCCAAEAIRVPGGCGPRLRSLSS